MNINVKMYYYLKVYLIEDEQDDARQLRLR